MLDAQKSNALLAMLRHQKGNRSILRIGDINIKIVILNFLSPSHKRFVSLLQHIGASLERGRPSSKRIKIT